MSNSTDIVPELLKGIITEIKEKYASDDEIQKLLNSVEDGSATYGDALRFAELVGDKCGRALVNHLTVEKLPDGRIYYNIGNRIVNGVVKEAEKVVNNFIYQTQKNLNKKANLGINPVVAGVNRDRVSGFVERIVNTEQADEAITDLLEIPANLMQNIVDESIKKNVELHGEAGLKATVTRSAEAGACEWCQRVTGTWSYPKVPKDVYRRHANCRCVVEYEPGDGKRQNVHTKKWYKPDKETLENRRKLAKQKKDDLFSIKVKDQKEAKALDRLLDKSKNDKINVKEEYLHSRFDYVMDGKEDFIPKRAKFEHTKVIAGHSTNTTLRIANSLSKEFGGRPENWKKKVGLIESDLYKFDMHWYEMNGSNKQYKMKLKHKGIRKGREK